MGRPQTQAGSAAASLDLDEYAVPVGYWDEKGLAQGTGFLGRVDGQVALYTAAHNLFGAEPVATAGWSGWTRAIEVFTEHEAGSVGVRVDAFVDSDPLTENFEWSPNPQRPGYMIDAVRFDQTKAADQLAALAARYRVIDLRYAKQHLVGGENLTCVGYPRRTEKPDDFPYYPPSRCDGAFLEYVHGAIQADYRAVKGFSGGPVFTTDGLFAGMHVGGNSKVPHPYLLARIVTPGDILAIGAAPSHSDET